MPEPGLAVYAGIATVVAEAAAGIVGCIHVQPNHLPLAIQVAQVGAEAQVIGIGIVRVKPGLAGKDQASTQSCQVVDLGLVLVQVGCYTPTNQAATGGGLGRLGDFKEGA